MKLNTRHINLFILVALVLGGCGSAPQFSDVTGKEWRLIEVRTQPHNIVLDRTTLRAEGFGDIFTLRLDAERMSGVGAPNRYTAPFTLAENQAIRVQPVAGTLMAAFHEPEKLNEREFFVYVQNAYRWNLANGRFELYTRGDDGTEATLVFGL